MDEADIASEYEAVNNTALITARRPSGPTATGECLYCQEKLADDKRWCDASCRDDWQRLASRPKEVPDA